MLCHFFQSKIDTNRTGLPLVPGEQSINISLLSSSLTSLEPALAEEIAHIIRKSPSKQSVLDPIPTWLVKEALVPLVPYIPGVVNDSLASGCVPGCMKQAIVTPLLKKPSLDSELLKNYRPVSNLSYVSKVLERIVSSRLAGYMQSNNLYEKLQSAYKQHRDSAT